MFLSTFRNLCSFPLRDEQFYHVYVYDGLFRRLSKAQRLRRQYNMSYFPAIKFLQNYCYARERTIDKQR